MNSYFRRMPLLTVCMSAMTCTALPMPWSTQVLQPTEGLHRQEIGQRADLTSALTALSGKDGSFEGNEVPNCPFGLPIMKAPVYGNPDLSLDPKTLTYLSPDTFYPLSMFSMRAMEGKMEVMSEFDGDIVSRFKGNHIRTINVVVDDALAGATVFIKNADMETVFEEELDLDALGPYQMEVPGYGTFPLGKLAEVAVDYEIGEDPFYVGYVPEVSEDASYGYYYMIAQVNNPHKGCCILDRYDGQGPFEFNNCVPFMWCDTEGEGGLHKFDVSMNGVTDIRALCGSEYMISGTLTNFGTEPVENITFSYTGPDGSVRQRVLDSPEPLPYMTTISFNVPILANEESGFYDKLMEVSNINGSPDELSDDNSTEYRLIAIKDPAHRNVLIEDYTGTWCGYCPRGMAAFDLLHELYPDCCVTTNFHVDDSMSVDVEGYSEMKLRVLGYPDAIVNHIYVADPWSGLDPAAEFGMGDMIKLILDQPVEVEVDAEAVYDAASAEIVVNTSFSSMVDVPDGGMYQLGFTVLEDGYRGLQSNDYSNEKGFWNKDQLPEAMWPFFDLPEHFVYEYEDVVRDGYGVMGLEGSVPSKKISTGEKVQGEIRFTPENIQDFNKVSVVAYVLDASTGEVLNAVKTPLQMESSVDSVIRPDYAIVKKNDGISVSGEGSLSVTVYTIDGRMVASNCGFDSIDLILGKVTGIYMVKVESTSGISTCKIVF